MLVSPCATNVRGACSNDIKKKDYETLYGKRLEVKLYCYQEFMSESFTERAYFLIDIFPFPH